MTKIFYYPMIRTIEDWNDCLSRAAWYLFPYIKQIEKIEIPVMAKLPMDVQVPKYLDKSIISRLPTVMPKVKQIFDKKNTTQLLSIIEEQADLLMIWEWPKEQKEIEDLEKTLSKFNSPRRYYKIDRWKTRNEGSFFLWIGEHCFPNSQLIEKSCDAFNRFANTIQKEKGYVLGTGPSLSMTQDMDLSDGDCIVCNSIVKNRKLMHHLSPKALTAGDPIFHAGCSEYAAQFRKNLSEVMEEFPDLFVFVPMRDYRIYLSFLREEHTNRIVALPFNQNAPYNVSLKENFYSNGTPNILTLLMLPLASTFYNEIYIGGCDGRPLSESNYFWKHDPQTQFNDKMENIKTVHPSFFEIQYNDYYLKHCNTLEEYIQAIEKTGKVVKGLTPSHIPALNRRETDPLNQPDVSEMATDNGISPGDSKDIHVVSINPDAIDEVGHFLAYEDLLAETFSSINIPYLSLCNQSFKSDLLANRPHIQPVLTTHSWTLGNHPGEGVEPSESIKKAFKQEILAIVDQLSQEHPETQLIFYMYCGSLYHAEQFLECVYKYPNICGVITLFWLSFVSIENSDFLNRWLSLLYCALQEKRLTLVVPTKEMQREILQSTGFELPVLPHPSTTIDDATFIQLRKTLVASTPQKIEANQEVKILFPGNLLKNKGYVYVLEATKIISNRIQSSQLKWQNPVTFTIRHAKPTNCPQEVQKFIQEIRQYATILEGGLEREAFIDLIRSNEVIVLPYLPEAFSNRTSGLLIDAIYCGVPVVAFANTWLGNLITKTNCGVAVRELSGEAIADAIEEVIHNYSLYRQAALDASQSFFQKNNWRALAETILESSLRSHTSTSKQAEILAEIANQAIKTATEATEAANRVANLFYQSNISNAALFQPFGRHLADEHINEFVKVWLPALNLQLDQKALGYLAHQICLIEDACSGRLATTVEDMLLRILVARSVQSRELSVLEIGSLFGINLGILYESCRGYFETIHLTALDPLDGYYTQSLFDKITQVPVNHETFDRNMRRLDIPGENVTLIQSLSTDDKALIIAGQNQYNLLVIDGDHSYAGVKFDFDHYLAAVDVGGCIIFDDYATEHWPEVAQFVDKEVKPNPCVEFIGASWRTAVFRVIRRNLK